ncbi:SMP-30/gluconolactonase/LRE family protein [Aliikangiella coralliicola]|nr:SMP-30/gluconolactonase/LRE family protein [Aliikangiella coralliicola]
MSKVESLVNSQCILGEGPLWVADRKKVFWVDIKTGVLYCLKTDNGHLAQWHFSTPLTSIVERTNGRYFGTTAQGFVEIDLEGTKLNLIGGPEIENVSNRHNDAKVDPFGNLWSGTMDDNEVHLSGNLYCLDKFGRCEVRDTNYCVSNGPTFSPNGQILYHTDTFQRRIFQYKLSPDGKLSDKRLFVEIEPKDGFPDGMTTDVEGNIWVCLYGGHKIIRFSPEGKLLEEFPMPCANITSCAFGGDNMDLLYITTAKWTLSEREIAEQPLSGNLLVMTTNTQGVASEKYQG